MNSTDAETAEWGQRRFNARGYPHSDVLLERVCPEVRGARMLAGLPAVLLSTLNARQYECRRPPPQNPDTQLSWKETWGDAILTSLGIWMCTFAQLRVSSCRAHYAFVHKHSHILATESSCDEMLRGRSLKNGLFMYR